MICQPLNYELKLDLDAPTNFFLIQIVARTYACAMCVCVIARIPGGVCLGARTRPVRCYVSPPISGGKKILRSEAKKVER